MIGIESKLLVSPSIAPIMLPYIILYIRPLKEFTSWPVYQILQAFFSSSLFFTVSLGALNILLGFARCSRIVLVLCGLFWASSKSVEIPLKPEDPRRIESLTHVIVRIFQVFLGCC